MAVISLMAGVGEDIDRILEHLTQYGSENASERIKEIMQAITILESSPLIGRPVDDKRELIIGRRSHGYVALYRFIAEIDTVFVLAIRGQRENGF